MPDRTNRWAMPAIAVLVGGIGLAAAAIGSEPLLGLGFLAIMCIYAAVLAFGRRSQTVRTLAGTPDDERLDQLDARAQLFSGHVVLLAVLAAFVVEIARGQDGSPYHQLAFAGGLSYVAALLWLRSRA